MEAIPLGKSRGGTPADERARNGARRTARCGGCGPTFAGVPPSLFFDEGKKKQRVKAKSGDEFSHSRLPEHQTQTRTRRESAPYFPPPHEVRGRGTARSAVEHL
jgi:hypothetical protein